MSMKQEINHSPVDRVVDYIKTQIAEKQVNPGDRLPSERKLSELLKVGRPHIRAALQKLENLWCCRNKTTERNHRNRIF